MPNRRWSLGSFLATKQKIEPSGAPRYEEGSEGETNEAATVQRGDDQQRKADADERDRQDRGRNSVRAVQAAARAPTTITRQCACLRT